MWISLAIGQHFFVWLNPSCEKGLSAGSIFQRPLCLRFKYEYHLRKTFGKQCSVDCFYRLLELSALKDEIYQRNKTPIYFSIWFVQCVMKQCTTNMIEATWSELKLFFFPFLFIYVATLVFLSCSGPPLWWVTHWGRPISETRLMVTEKILFQSLFTHTNTHIGND